MQIFKCTKCGNIFTYFNKDACDLKCYGETTVELVPNTSDGAGEKHVPVIVADGKKVTVKVGEVAHPMLDAHYITWVIIETKEGSQIKYLKPGDAPEATFALSDTDELVAAYEYCNLHGLWKAEA